MLAPPDDDSEPNNNLQRPIMAGLPLWPFRDSFRRRHLAL